SPARRIDAVLSRQVQTSLAFRSPGFHLIAPYRDRGGAGVSRLSRMSVEATRFVRLEFQPGEPGAPEKKPEAAAAKRAGPEECESLMGRFDKAIRSIEAHGGRVVLLFMPLTGASADIEERDFPRSEYWDPISPSSKALRVHFRDYPALAGFTCPDGEHLDGVDAVRFTRALADILGSHLD
ncbi:MAG TPA: hypothetical protein VJS20_05765, partial [Gemmatimonadales bacterium]|nr:hypothetical protein [Gemmatimonadales bacterium]